MTLCLPRSQRKLKAVFGYTVSRLLPNSQMKIAEKVAVVLVVGRTARQHRKANFAHWKTEKRSYPGISLVVQWLRLQVRGPGFDPWSGN